MYKYKYIIIFIILTSSKIGYSFGFQEYPLCGPYCLKIIANYNNVDVKIDKILELSQYDEKYGTNMYCLYRAACSLGLPAVCVRTSMNKLKKIGLPAIVYIYDNHFIVIHDIGWFNIKIEYPPDQIKIIRKKEFLEHWNGEAIVFSSILAEHNSDISKEAHLIIPKRKNYYGTVCEGSIAQYSIPIYNDGLKPLKIHLRQSCSCIKVNEYQVTINPRDSLNLKFDFDTKNIYGFNEKYVYLYTNDPINENVVLTLSVTIKKDVEVFPKNIYLDHVLEGTKIIREIYINDYSNHNLKIQEIKVPDNITATVLPPFADNNNRRIFKIIVTIDTKYLHEYYKENITIIAMDDELHSIEVGIEGIIIGKVNASPDILFFGNCSNGNTIVRKSTITINSEYIPKLLTATTSNNTINTNIIYINERTYILEVSISNDISNNGEIFVFIDDGVEPALKLSAIVNSKNQ